MEAFHCAGALVACTKDYHPHDHCSFMGHGGFFPQHCVQGSPGTKLFSPICAKLCELMRRDIKAGKSGDSLGGTSGAKVAWKGFHQQVDSFGAVEYPPNADGAEQPEGRFVATYGGVGPCQLSCWTGAFVLKASHMTGWDCGGELSAEHIDAPPDVFSVYDKRPLHEVVKAHQEVHLQGL